MATTTKPQDVTPAPLGAQQAEKIGSTTLALFESVAEADKGKAAATMAVDLFARGARELIAPWLAEGLRSQLRTYATSALGSGEAATMGEQLLREVGLATITPAVDMIVDGAVMVVTDRKGALERLKGALSSAANAFLHPIDTIANMGSAHDWAMRGRSAILTGVRLGTQAAFVVLGEYINAATETQLGTAIQYLAPYAARVVTMGCDVAMHRAYPMTDVRAETLPEQDKPFAFLYALKTTARDRTETIPGQFAVTLEVDAKEAYTPLLAGSSGSIVVEMGNHGALTGKIALDKLTLVIGGAYTLTGLAGACRHGVGLEIVAAKMTAKDASVQPELDHLAISPYGWLSGGFHVGDKRFEIGSEFPGGVHELPSPEATVGAKRDGASASGPGGLAGDLHRKLSTLPYARIVSGVALAVNYAMNSPSTTALWRAPKRDAEPQAEATPPQQEPSALAKIAKKLGMDPTEFFERITQEASLVRGEFAKRIHIGIDELDVDHDGAIALGATLIVTPFPESANPGAAQLGLNNLRIIWFIDKEPYLLLQARDVTLGQRLAFYGIEADPAGGLRIAAARIALPGLKADGIFGMDEIDAYAEGIAVGTTFRARKAGTTVKGLTIGNVIEIGEVGVEIEPGEDKTRFSSTIANGKIDAGKLHMDFGGAFAWGGGKTAEGSGTATLREKLTVVENAFSIDRAAVSLAIAPPTFSGAATDLAVTLRGYELSTSGTVAVDERGLKSLTASAALTDKAKQPIGTIKGLEYQRDSRLVIEEITLALPKKGPVRALPEKGRETERSYLRLQNLDLSTLLAKVPHGETDGSERGEVGEVGEPAPKTEATPTAEPTRSFAISGENLGGIAVGPDDEPIGMITFAPPPKDAKQKGLNGAIQLRLGSTKATGNVAIASDPDQLDGVSVTGTSIAIGEAGSIAELSYAKHQLAVTDAKLHLAELLSSLWPGELKGMEKADLTAGFAVDTESRRLTSASFGVSDVNADVFGGHVHIANGAATAKVTDGEVKPSGEHALSGELSGSLSGTLAISFHGVSIELAGELALGRTVSGKLAKGLGKRGGTSIAVENLQFVGGEYVKLGSLVATIEKPKDGDLLSFMLGSAHGLDPEKPITVELKDVMFNFASADEKPEATSRAIKADGISTPVAPSLDEGPADDATPAQDAPVQLGRFGGLVKQESLAALGGKGGRALKVASAKVGETFEVRELTYHKGALGVQQATLSLQEVLGGLPSELDALKKLKATVTGLKVTPKRQIIVDGITVEAGADIGLFSDKLKLKNLALGITPKLVDFGTGDAAPLLAGDWNATLSAAIEIHPAPNLEISTTKAEISASKQGWSATIDNPTVGWHKGFAASAKQLALRPGTFMVHGAELRVSTALIKDLPGLADLVAQLPSWAKTDFVLAVRNIDIGYENGAIQWPSKNLGFGLRRGRFQLGEIFAGFDLDAKTLELGGSLSHTFSAMAQLPFAHGVGVELGAELSAGVKLGAKATLEDSEDMLKPTTELDFHASLSGTAKAGIFGGVPSLFSASGGIFVGVKLDLPVSARIAGQVPLPSSKSKSATAFDALFQLRDKATGKHPEIVGSAGAYASFHFMGTSRTLYKPLVTKRIAELHGHGGIGFRAGDGVSIDFLPSRDRFPVHAFHLDEKLREQLFDTDFAKQLERAQRRLDKSFATVWAAESLLDEKPTADPQAKPWKDQTQALKKDEEKAKIEKQKADDAVKDIAKTTKVSTALLEGLRKDVKLLDWQIETLTKLEKEGKTKSRSLRRLFKGPMGQSVSTEELDGKPAFLAAVYDTTSDVTARIQSEEFAAKHGATGERKLQTAAMLQMALGAKHAEIDAVQQEMDDSGRSDAEDRQAAADAVYTEARAKQELSTKSRGKVQKELASAQTKLLESFYTASKVEVRSNDQQLAGAAAIDELERELAAAKTEVTKLPEKDESPQAQFWREHVKFLEEELRFTKDREAKRTYASRKFDDGIGAHAQSSLETAASAQPAKVEQLDERIDDKVEKRRTDIERSIRKLQGQLTRIENAKATAKDKQLTDLEESRARCQRALDLQKRQLMAYLDTIARVDARTHAPAKKPAKAESEAVEHEKGTDDLD